MALFDRLAWILLVLVAAVALLTMRDYGYSWDEVWQNRWYGQAVLDYLGNGDRRATNYVNLHLYGGLYDGLAELLVRLLPFEGFTSRRLCNVMVGLVAVAGTWRLARSLGGPAAGFWAMLVLVLTPTFYGHVFINAKDIPFAAGAIWTLHAIGRIVRRFPEARWSDGLLLGVAVGFALGVRIGGVLLVAYAGLALVLYIGLATWRDGGPPRALLRMTTWAKLGVVPATLSVGLMLVLWPAAIEAPFATITESLRETRQFTFEGSLLFRGEIVEAMRLPWNYALVMFAVKLPEPILVAVVASMVWLLSSITRSLRSRDAGWLVAVCVTLFAIVFPPAYAMVTGATTYDGIRHFLFVVPPMAVVAGLGIDAASRWLGRRPGLARACAAVLAAWALYHVFTLGRLHPYTYCYYNRIAGGMPAAGERFETDYWTTAYKEATGKLLTHARRVAASSGLPIDKLTIRVAVAGEAQNVQAFLPANFRALHPSQVERPEFYIGHTRDRKHLEYPDMVEIARVERCGMLFAVVKARR